MERIKINGRKIKIGTAEDFMEYATTGGYDLDDPFIDDAEPVRFWNNKIIIVQLLWCTVSVHSNIQ